LAHFPLAFAGKAGTTVQIVVLIDIA
jgi:hypothetical protein